MECWWSAWNIVCVCVSKLREKQNVYINTATIQKTTISTSYKFFITLFLFLKLCCVSKCCDSVAMMIYVFMFLIEIVAINKKKVKRRNSVKNIEAPGRKIINFCVDTFHNCCPEDKWFCSNLLHNFSSELSHSCTKGWTFYLYSRKKRDKLVQIILKSLVAYFDVDIRLLVWQINWLTAAWQINSWTAV